MHRTFLGHLETGRKDFRLTTIIRVADALGVTLSELFAGVQGGRPPKKLHFSSDDQDRVRREVANLEQAVRNLKTVLQNQPGAPELRPSRRHYAGPKNS